MSQKVVICGAGFLGLNIAKALISKRVSEAGSSTLRRVQISSRDPKKVHESLKAVEDQSCLLPPAQLDVTKPATLVDPFRDASIVVSLVGIMYGTPKMFEEVQLRGAENIARATKNAGAKLIHFSAIGADPNSHIPYVKTKGLAEASVLEICPDATVIRPSLVFGSGDDFFNRFARLARILPFLPVFGGGTARFQPVFVEDVAQLVEIVSRGDMKINRAVSGKIIEAGGPDVLTYRELMLLVLKYGNRWRPVISLPFTLGMMQGALLERLPLNLFTVTRAQVEQLKSDNIVNPHPRADELSLREILETHAYKLKSLDQILPTYL